MCKCKDDPSKCQYPDDCIHFDDYLYTLPINEDAINLQSVGDDGICRTFPGASFWYD